MLPPGRMHLWWEGMAKHVVTWILQLIEDNYKEKKVAWGPSMLDEMLMTFDCKHSDRDVPTHRFHSGISNLKMIPAKHMLPLMVQLQVILGCDFQFVTRSQHDEVHMIFACFIRLGYLLHLDEYTEQHLSEIDATVRRYSKICFCNNKQTKYQPSTMEICFCNKKTKKFNLHR